MKLFIIATIVGTLAATSARLLQHSVKFNRNNCPRRVELKTQSSYSETDNFGDIFDIPTEFTEEAIPVRKIGTSLSHSPSLVLNADYTPLSHLPLSLWNWQDAIRAILADKAVVVSEYNIVIRGVSCELKLPSVIALKQYHKNPINTPTITRQKVFLRDNYRCQYCLCGFREEFLSLDHVFPRSRGGKMEWTNIVTACKECNSKKGQLMPTEIASVGLKLRNLPKQPSMATLQNNARKLKSKKSLHPDWLAYV